MDFRSAANFGNISKQIEKLSKKNYQNNDERFWAPSVDKQGDGYAVIRLLPTPQIDGPTGQPIIYHQSYSFKGPSGKWYIEDSPVMIGQPDPVYEANNRDYNSGTEEAKERAKMRAMRKLYICNVFVLDDPANREAEGKVWLYKMPISVFEIVQQAFTPKYKDEQAFNPFDLETGASLRLKIYTDGKFRKYDRSAFGPVGPLFSDTDKLMDVWKQAYSLAEFLDPSKFKSYDELKKHFEDVMDMATPNIMDMDKLPQARALNIGTEVPRQENPAPAKADFGGDSIPTFDVKVTAPQPASADEDKSIAYFRDLANS